MITHFPYVYTSNITIPSRQSPQPRVLVQIIQFKSATGGK